MIKCAVNGQRRPGYMCGSIIVGNKTCGFEGACEHQRTNDDSVITSPERVEKTPKRIHMRQAGSFSANYYFLLISLQIRTNHA